MAALVGFSGSRSLPGSFAPVVRSLVASVQRSGRSVAVGCASGLDAFVRQACASLPGCSPAQVFRAESSLRYALVERSVSFIRAVAASGSGCGFVVFPGQACPFGLVPSSNPNTCFRGLGSGSWAAAAFAAGLGVPLVVFGLAASQLPVSWGAWVPAAASGCWASGFKLVPAAPVQGSLF